MLKLAQNSLRFEVRSPSGSFVASVVGKIYKLRTEKLRELEAPWQISTKKFQRSL